MNSKLSIVFSLFVGIIAGSADLARAAEGTDDMEERLADTEERLDQVEKRSVLNRLSLDGDYRTILNHFVYEGPSPDPFDPDPANPAVGRQIQRTSGELWSHRLRVGMKAEPLPSLRVTARMVMFKHYGDMDTPAFVSDNSTSRVPRDSGAHFDQAWLDWFMTDWLALSAGRIAYAEGNPSELRDNSDIRRATWGLHMVDGEYDTINLTLNLSSVIKGWYARLFYASWFYDNDDDVFGSFGFLDSGTDNLRIFGGNLDIRIPGLGKNFVQLGYYLVPEFRPFSLPITNPAFDPDADATHAPAPLNGSLLFPSRMPSSLGSYQSLSALFQFYDMFGTGLDLFFSGSMGILDPNGQGIEYELPSDPTNPGSPSDSTPFLFLSSQGDDGITFFAYAGLRYTLPIETLRHPKLGFEFNHGSRYHISFNVQNDNLLNKLATRGSAYEAYYIQPFNPHLFLRLSYLYIDADYQGGFFGPNPDLFGSTSVAAGQQIQNFNLTLHVEF